MPGWVNAEDQIREMAGHLRYGLALQGVLKQLECLSVRGVRNAHTIAVSNPARNLAPVMLIHHLNSHQASPPATYNILSPLHKTEIREKVKPFKIIEKPETPGFDSSISNPLSNSITPIKSPNLNKTVIKPPSTDTPMSASKNGNKYILRLRKSRMKKRQLDKLSAKFWPIMKKIHFLRALKKENNLKKELANLVKEGEDYDYLAEIKLHLEEAKLNGYKYDMTASLEEAFVVKQGEEVTDGVKQEKESLLSVLSSGPGILNNKKSK